MVDIRISKLCAKKVDKSKSRFNSALKCVFFALCAKVC